MRCRRVTLCLLLNIGLLLSVAFVCQSSLADESRLTSPGKVLAYVGTYTRGNSKGIYRFWLDLKTGQPGKAELATEASNPSFLAIHSSSKWLYAVNEVGRFRDQDNSGGVSAFAIDSTSGDLKLLNQQPSRGGAPCHLVVDKTGKFVLVANYSGGNVAAFPIRDNGSLAKDSAFIQHTGSSVTPRQKGPHAHSINLDAANRFAFAADLGLDQVLIYRFDPSNGSLTAHDPPFAKVKPGGGPRHFAFHPSGKFAYVNNEMTSSVTGFAYNAKQGSLDEFQTLSTLPADFTGNNSTAEVQVSPNGKFLFVSNRGHNSIAVYLIDQQTGRLSAVEQQSTRGKTPRNFAVDPSGQFLLAENQQSDNIVVFRINQDSGKLTATGHTVDVPSPVCVKFLH